jgi:hypothetical protein
LGVRDTRAGLRCRSLEVLPPIGKYGFVSVIDSLVVAQLPLRLMRHQTKDADVRVSHNRAPLGSGSEIETAVAWGSS